LYSRLVDTVILPSSELLQPANAETRIRNKNKFFIIRVLFSVDDK